MDKRPSGITVACLVFAITALVTLYAGITIKTATTGASGTALMTVDNQPIQSYFLLNTENVALSGTGLGMIVLGLIFAAMAWFLWQKNELAWYFSVALVGVSIIMDIVAMLFFGYAVATVGVIALVINVLVLLVLFHEDTISAVNPREINWKGWNASSISS